MNDFFANWYELLAYFDGFSDDMFRENLYISIGMCMVLIPIVVLSIYYYAVDADRFSKWWHWLLMVVVLCADSFWIAYSTSYNELDYLYSQLGKPLPYSIEFFSFSLVNVLWTAIVAFVWSMIIKWGSKNCRRTPF